MWAVDNAPHGDLTDISAATIARAALWPRKNHATFVGALVDAGFIDSENERLLIHDYEEYIGKLTARREQNKDRMSRARAGHVRNTNGARAPATVPNPTGPDRTVPDPTPQPPSEPSDGGDAALPRPNDEKTTGSTSDACCVLAEVSGGQQHAAACSGSSRA
jgi:hypothetical protein